MEKLVVKAKKEIKLHLMDSLRQTIHTLGLEKGNKKTEKLIANSSKKLASSVAKQMKKELKKIAKLKKKTERKKDKELVEAMA